MTDSIVYKILTRAEVTVFDDTGRFDGAAVDLNDGFIHLSAAHQVEGTLRKHFARKGALVLIGLDPAAMSDGSLKWEVSRGDALFPHLYEPMTKAMEVMRHDLGPDHALPDGLKGFHT